LDGAGRHWAARRDPGASPSEEAMGCSSETFGAYSPFAAGCWLGGAFWLGKGCWFVLENCTDTWLIPTTEKQGFLFFVFPS